MNTNSSVRNLERGEGSLRKEARAKALATNESVAERSRPKIMMPMAALPQANA